MKVFNTESRLKEEFIPSEEGQVRMYTCGPTVYNFAHIGNFRTYVFEDLLRRTLKFFGLKITQVMNITDIDDKTIKGAIEKNISLKQFTDPYTKAFFEDLQTLSIEPVEFNPRATDYIPDMIVLIQKLLEEGIAYRGDDKSIYYSIDKFPSYGRLSHLHLGELKRDKTINCDEYDKENISDFVLWKAYDPQRDGNIFWESPLGPGRPGWHIECSAMAMKLLGPTIDIHVGGVDNMFPHHENEIAQSEGCTQQRFVRYWMHAEHLLVDHKKMSKSLGNFYTLRDLLSKGFSGTEVRFLLLSTHYRTQLNFTFQGLEAARHSLERFADFIHRLRGIDQPHSFGLVEPLLKKCFHDFSEALGDDLNISVAMASLFDLVREINSLCDAGKISREEASKVLYFLEQCDRVLGVLPLKAKAEEISADLIELLQKREAARAAKNWKAADECRDLLLKQGYVIEDTPSGARLKRKA
ncbi:MAG: cysteine--tRNA ligase [Verrucomicrobia bacterium]|nr:cysteine--tRNA ligase [Verrucomicrobiota bacterium]